MWLKLCTRELGPYLSYRNGTPEVSYSRAPDPHTSTFPVGKKESLHSSEAVSGFSVGKRTFWNRTWKRLASLRSSSCSHRVSPVFRHVLSCVNGFCTIQTTSDTSKLRMSVFTGLFVMLETEFKSTHVSVKCSDTELYSSSALQDQFLLFACFCFSRQGFSV